MMLPIVTALLVASYVCTTSALHPTLILPDNVPNITNKTATSAELQYITSFNASFSLGDTTLPPARCLSDPLRTGLPKIGCAGALLKINAMDKNSRSWGVRGTGQFDNNLPRRFINPTGECVVDTVLTRGASVAHASMNQIFQGGHAIWKKCVQPAGLGGAADPIGGDNNLVVLMSKYTSKATCWGFIDNDNITNSCQSILDTMPTDTQTVSFGGRSRIRLPLFLRSADGRCELQLIKLQGHCDKSSWREVWDYGVELNGVCAAQKKRGNSPAFGANGRLLFSLVPKWPVSDS